jgi:protocatechuate 3,4-dioxygenase beta subunit
MNRRQLLQRAGAAGLAATFGGLHVPAGAEAAANKLALTPEQEEGPFYVALNKVRKNITLGKPGETTAGKPVKSAACDIWQCDASGVYSDEASESTVGQTYLRGVQLTNAEGIAEFITVYPGYYQGRTTHIHVKVHVGGKVVHTGQLYFPDPLTASVYRNRSPYRTRGQKDTSNAADMVFADGGKQSMLRLSQHGTGYVGRLALGVRS